MKYLVKVSVEESGTTSTHFVDAADWRMEFDEGIRLLVMERRCRVTVERWTKRRTRRSFRASSSTGGPAEGIDRSGRIRGATAQGDAR